MPYAELAYFDGHHVAHIAAWQEQQRLTRIRTDSIRAMDRRGTCRR